MLAYRLIRNSGRLQATLTYCMSLSIIYPEAKAIDRTHSRKVIATKIHKFGSLGLRLAAVNNTPNHSSADKYLSYNLRRGLSRVVGLLFGRSIAAPLERLPTS
jgi:hypothetical protein